MIGSKLNCLEVNVVLIAQLGPSFKLKSKVCLDQSGALKYLFTTIHTNQTLERVLGLVGRALTNHI